jgi:hypothetical protein
MDEGAMAMKRYFVVISMLSPITLPQTQVSALAAPSLVRETLDTNGGAPSSA